MRSPSSIPTTAYWPGPRQPQSQLVATGFFAVALLAWLGWVAYGLVAQPRYRLIWACEIPLGLVVLVPALLAGLRRKLDLFAGNTVFCGYLFAQEGMWTAYMLTTGQAHMHSTVATYLQSLPLVLLYTSLALVLFQLPWAFPARRTSPAQRCWHLSRLRVLAVVLPGLAVAAFLFFTYQVGGLSSYISSLGSNRVVELTGLWGYIMFAEALMALGGACALILGVLQGSLRWRLYAGTTAGTGVMIGLLAGYRLLSLIPLVTFLALYHYLVRRFQISLRALLALVVATMLSSIYSNARDRPELARAGGWTQITSAFFDASGYASAVDALLQRLQGSETFAVVLANTARTGGYQYGFRALAQAPTMLIPRALWPTSPFKEDPEGVRFGTLFFGNAWGTLGQMGGISPTWAAEVYWNFGLPGVLLGSLALGYASRRLYLRALYPLSGWDLMLLAYVPLALMLLAEAPSDALTGVMVVLLPMLSLRGWLCPRAAMAAAVQPAAAAISGWDRGGLLTGASGMGGR